MSEGQEPQPKEPDRKKTGLRGHFIYHTALLGAVALLASTALIVGHLKTRGPIAERAAEDMQASLQQVIAHGLYDNNLIADHARLQLDPEHSVEVFRARKAGKVTALAYQVSGWGYSGNIDLIMGIDRDGKLLGVRVIAHSETPGLGDKMETAKSDWIYSFDGRSLGDPVSAKWKVKKDGGVFDQFTGATITPRAIVKAVHEGLELFATHREAFLGEDARDIPPGNSAALKQAAHSE